MAISIRTMPRCLDSYFVQRIGLSGALVYTTKDDEVVVSATLNHKMMCERVLGAYTSEIDDGVQWRNVPGTKLVELLYKLDKVRLDKVPK